MNSSISAPQGNSRFFSLYPSGVTAIPGTVYTTVSMTPQVNGDPLNGWDPVLDQYTVPIGGWWRLSASLGYASIQGTSYRYAVAIWSNGAIVFEDYGWRDEDYLCTLKCGGLTFLNAGDLLTLQSKQYRGSSVNVDTNGHRVFFDGVWVRA